tara:strand:- start:563 stop:922 length:360 start_codon:yes stop_codon:yes gene_type:complete
MAYAFDDDEVEFWWSQDGRGNLNTFPQKLIDYFISGGVVFAHNADFERHLFDYVISNDYNFEAPALTQWRCTMVMALTNGYAGGLDAASQGAGVPYKKHSAGKRLIKEYCAQGHKDIFA